MAKKNKKSKAVILGVFVAYVLIMLIGYLGVSFYFSSHFLKGTVINGVDSSNKTVKQVKKDIQDKVEEYNLQLVELDGKTEEVTAVQVGMVYVDDKKVDGLMESQNQWKWLTSFSNASSYEVPVNTTYDRGFLDGILDRMSCFKEENIVAPQNAYVEEQKGAYEIVPEVYGNTLDREKVKAAVIEALDAEKTEINLEELGCYLKPTVYQDNEGLIRERDARNQIMNTKLVYDFGDRTEVVDGNLIKDWVTWGEESEWTINEEKAAEYVQQLAYKYDTFGLTHEFTTFSGRKITLKGGDYGWVIKKKETTEALIDAIKRGVSGTIKPVYLYQGKCRDLNDIGGTYVEISIQEQRMWCYKNGSLIVDTPVVTGNSSKNYDTPSGSVWAIDAKKSPSVLEGEGYKQPVQYWMPFVGNVGIHDADTWRSEYGGDIYKTSGSHGCVNTPTANAEKIFYAVEIGTPVIVY